VREGTRWTRQAYLKASNAEADDRFGISVSISGDTSVVGAYGESSSATGVNDNQNNNGATSAGAACVFVREGTIWTQQAYLKASNTGADDLFGESVSISGDVIVVAVDEYIAVCMYSGVAVFGNGTGTTGTIGTTGSIAITPEEIEASGKCCLFIVSNFVCRKC
jgi:hypothetical protein